MVLRAHAWVLPHADKTGYENELLEDVGKGD
jgi:hypothetical protein